MRSFIVLLLALVLGSVTKGCRGVSEETTQFLDVKQVKSYKGRDKTPFLVEEFSQAGKKISSFQLDSDGSKRGVCFYLTTDSDSIVEDYTIYTNAIEERRFLANGEIEIFRYQDSAKFSICEKYKNDTLILKGLFKKDKCISYECYTYNLTDTYLLKNIDKTRSLTVDSMYVSGRQYGSVVEQYREIPKTNKFDKVGYYFRKQENGRIDDSISNYLRLEVPFVNSPSDSIQLNIYGKYVLGNGKDVNITAYIGDVDLVEELIRHPEENSSYHVELKDFKATFKYPPQQNGYHLIVVPILIHTRNFEAYQIMMLYADFIVSE